MTKKKAKKKAGAKNKAGAKKKSAAKESAAKSGAGKKSKAGKNFDLAEVRKNIAAMVMGEHEEITQAVLLDAKRGQLSTVKYLYEMTGVYPTPSEEPETKVEDDSLAKTLLDRMNISIGTAPPRDGGGDVVQTATKEIEPEVEKAPAESEGVVEGEKSSEAVPASDCHRIT